LPRKDASPIAISAILANSIGSLARTDCPSSVPCDSGEGGAFCVLDNLTETDCLSLREAGLELAVVMDDQEGSCFLGIPVVSLEDGVGAGCGPIAITSLSRAERL
jgi:hypothetical protein